jgi:AraC family transcriptional activator of tynA and feaB
VRTLFSTTEIHPRDRFAYWNDSFCKQIVARDAVSECRHAFQAEMQVGEFAGVGISLCTHSAMRTTHTARHAAHSNPDVILICRLLSGARVIEHNGRDEVITAGDVVIVDPRMPYAMTYAAQSKHLMLRIPRRQFEARVGAARAFANCHIKCSDGDHRLTLAFLGMLPLYSDELPPATAEIVKDHALDLLAVSFAKAVNAGRPRISSARSFTLINVRAAIEQRLNDPTVDADTIAGASGVSVRYANAVLAKEGTSITRLIQARRLERCRKAFEDPSQASRTVSEIAYGWGFSDMTHFGRKFKAAFGVPPSEYRKGTKLP